MKVVVTQMGFHKGSRVRPGEVIEWTGPLPKWLKPVEEVSATKAAKPKALQGDLKPKAAQEVSADKATGIIKPPSDGDDDLI
jgi:hypothetical protein